MCSIGWSYKILRLLRNIICKRLLEYAAEMVNTANALELDRLSSLAYEILQDNVVYNARLLRLLLSICLPTHQALYEDFCDVGKKNCRDHPDVSKRFQ
ncbi:hypothetical protein PsorP6_019619 [Peronosclerospora sorghi]|nr:hypothetical protein PsorP6_019619 [Peronosclerospora sorghi]